MTVRTIVFVLAAAAGCAQSAAAAQASPLASTAITATAAASGPTPLRVTGTLQTYDAEQKQVAVTTPAGSLQLLMTRDTRVRQGGHTVDAGQLRSRIGSKVVVRYLEAERGRVLVSLTVIDRGGGGPH
ncbi:MAG: hypothetical protein U0Q11_25720 [Vicinamibacterales bacterium]